MNQDRSYASSYEIPSPSGGGLGPTLSRLSTKSEVGVMSEL